MSRHLENQYLDALKTAYGMAIILYMLMPFFTPLILFFPLGYLKFKFSRYNLQNEAIAEHYKSLFTSLTYNLMIVILGWAVAIEGHEVGLLVGFVATIFYMIKIILQKQKIPESI